MKRHDALHLAERLARAAGMEILQVYDTADIEIEEKSDHSPLTLADRRSHALIQRELSQRTPWPILSEEGKHLPHQERQQWETFWLVDPLDGTREFIKRNGEFTVNIALMHHNEPVLGVVYVPVQRLCYTGLIDSTGSVARRQRAQGEWDILCTNAFDPEMPGQKVVASRSHLNAETQSFLERLSDPEIVPMGSSLKFMALAEGKAHLYPRFGPTSEWDTAAAQAVLEAAGGSVLQPDGSRLRYNKENLLNPHFIASANPGYGAEIGASS